MALNNMGLGFVFTAQNLASGTIGRLQSQLGGLGATSTASGRTMAAGLGVAAAGIAPLIAGVGILSGSMGLANAAAEFERNVARVGNISGATTEELRLLRDAAIDAGIATQFSPDEAIGGLEALAAQGFAANDAIRLLGVSLNLASGGQIEIQEATRATAAAIRVFSLSVEEQETVADRLLRITNMTSLQAGDLSLALGTVSRGATVAGQSLDEMLISMGLVRNTGVDASVAASSVSSALIFAANNASQMSRDLGVAVTDAEGNFRPLLDIISEVDTSLSGRYTDAAERAAAATDLFGRFGLTAFAGISTQLHELIARDPADEINTMADAIAHLRGQMADSAGTAEQFSDALLDTFAGQLTLLEGTLQTFAVVLGEPFAAVFKPFVKFVVDGLNVILRFFNAMPDEIKVGIAAFIVFAGALLTTVGVMTILSGILVAISPFIVGIAQVLGAMLAVLAPLVVGIVLFGNTVSLVTMAVRRNLGGLGDWWTSTVGRMRLIWDGLTQLFTRGGFSGAVRDELNQAGNEGLRQFLVDVFRIGFRIRQFWEGFSQGIDDGMTALAPTFTALREAFEDLGRALGFMGSQGAASVAGIPSREFVRRGAEIAEVVTDIVRITVNGIANAVKWIADFTNGFRSSFTRFAPIFKNVGESFENLGLQVRLLFQAMGFGSDEGIRDTQTWGEVVGVVFGGIVSWMASTIGMVTNLVAAFAWGARQIVDGFVAVRDFFSAFWITLSTGVLNVVDTIANSIDSLLGMLGAVASLIPESMRGDRAQLAVIAGSGSDARIAARTRAIESRTAEGTGVIAQAQVEAKVRAESREGRGAESSARTDAIVRAIEQTRRADQIPVVNVQIDGETVARAVSNAGRRESARGFVPVPGAT